MFPRLSFTKQVVSFPSGRLVLHGVLFKPEGKGPFPTLLFNHGSYKDPSVAIETLGPVFASRGWVFFAPYRRGQGLSAEAGPYIQDQIRAAWQKGGVDEAAVTMVRLLETDHLNDQAAGFEWLKKQEFVSLKRIAVFGNSFGGVETLLGSGKLPYCAAVDASGARSLGQRRERYNLQ
jgi:dienelactone hydrolase